MQGKMAIIGDGDSVVAFKAGGVDAFKVSGVDEAKNYLRKLAKTYSIIFITEDLALSLDDLIKRMLEKAYPIIIPIPSKDGSNGYAMAKLKDQMERALGVDILFSREEK